MDHAITVQGDNWIARLLNSEVDLCGISQIDRVIQLAVIDFRRQPFLPIFVLILQHDGKGREAFVKIELLHALGAWNDIQFIALIAESAIRKENLKIQIQCSRLQRCDFHNLCQAVILNDLSINIHTCALICKGKRLAAPSRTAASSCR